MNMRDKCQYLARQNQQYIIDLLLLIRSPITHRYGLIPLDDIV
jgi:hypothetical protein